ncbi:hypothetical protein DMZ43_02435 [Meridianimaribacter sp. CL38]|uniref:hypothetical protein n=1 Tax=Meridianimaribacter sp. CL38 TaxID=2213021 RepID=UPI00103C8AF0|nr:hypothetical protein [Meridianimaribacter sp. CL38]TBV27921.1 hypothetical protein DMZ43_02435 [Meridianimaribacter sp. CL38]
MSFKKYFAFKRDNDSGNEYLLDDYDFLLTRYSDLNLTFENDFYLKVCLRKMLFDLSRMEIKSFLEVQLDNSENPDEFFELILSEIIPAIKTIISNAQINGFGIEYYKSIELENDFVASEGIIRNRFYDYRLFYHETSLFKYEMKFERIVEILKNFTNTYEENKTRDNIIIWKANPNILAYLISELANKGYLDAPLRNGKINNTQLTKQLLNTFKFVDKKPTFNGLKQFVIQNSEENEKLDYKLRGLGWEIPKNIS